MRTRKQDIFGLEGFYGVTYGFIGAAISAKSTEVGLHPFLSLARGGGFSMGFGSQGRET